MPSRLACPPGRHVNGSWPSSEGLGAGRKRARPGTAGFDHHRGERAAEVARSAVARLVGAASSSWPVHFYNHEDDTERLAGALRNPG